MGRFLERQLMGINLCTGSPPAPDASEALILVVGNDSIFMSQMARALAEDRNATKPLSKAGIRCFVRDHAPDEPVVIETAPFKTVKDLSRVDIARKWLSQNSIRQLSGEVCVVCTIASTDVDDEIFREPNFDHNEFSWLHILACAFEKCRNKIMFLVNSNGSNDDASRQRLRQVLKRDGFRWPENIIFARPSERGNDETAADNRSAALSPFRLPKVAQHGSDKYGPWGPVNIILFGISGSGKSTFAKMLTTGRLYGDDCLSTKFSTSSGLRGKTTKVNVGQGRGWRVVDTPGLGEPNDDKKRGISTDRAAQLIREYVMLFEGVYSHFIFVLKNERVTDEVTELWKVFNHIFQAEGHDNQMTIVVSGADEAWLDENRSYLETCFVGCSSFLAADFAPVPAELVGDKEAEKELEDIRLKSLKVLEENLASLCRMDLSCKLGSWSVGRQRSLLARGEDQLITPGTHIRQGPAFGPSAGLQPQPSDWETVRSLMRLKSWKTRTFLPGGKQLDLTRKTNP